MKAYMANEGLAPPILILGIRRRWVAYFTLRPFIPGKEPVGGWVGPTAGLVVSHRTKISCHYRDSNPGPCKQLVCLKRRRTSGPCLSRRIPVCVPCTGLFEMIVGVLTTATSFSRCNPMSFFSMGLRQGSGLCSTSSRKYPGTGTNQNRHWNHHRWHDTDSLERIRLSCWCL